ncbi:DUF2889 domain-containing protein (plasmid) [Burkholderia sp. FERM BP-3421]|jgi:hypothetical protein|uniref:DUF2889 domain-containing protein n=1 Tax=Burkholderia sp. FERM BP-3421 TaxID=1494466 RepID=UPI002362D852|nr:DUF2889 domain-containing protein [Burkholderia sp. FERM BP-3421]WDD90657.1 DUF2889 domain-containing protein [Burkholderia sp. FERM BP-3421]
MSTPLPNPQGDVEREPLHHRQIDLQGYRRSDGLYEVRAHLIDRKTHDFVPPGGDREIPAQTAVHDLGVSLVFDPATMIVRAVDTFVHAHPYAQCPGGGATLQALVGLRIGAGWNSEIRKRLPNCDTCTHLKELLGPLASTAIQTTVLLRTRAIHAQDGSGKPLKIDSCFTYGASRDLVRRLWPEHHRPETSEVKD